MVKFTVHCLVKNEDIWIRYALAAVLPYAEKIIVFDTGSTDGTVAAIKSLKSEKIVLEEKGEVDHRTLAQLRQEMIQKTATEWFLIVDGDEIWPKENLIKILKMAEIVDKSVVGIINHFRNSIGDIYHYLPDSTGNYQIAGRVGNITIRLIRKTPTLKLSGEYPLEMFSDKNGPLQNQEQNLIYSNAWYLHNTFLKRSSNAINKTSGSFGKIKYPESGITFNIDELPEVIKINLSTDINLKKRSIKYELMALLLMPLRIIKKLV